jgi:hypothetical protein
MLNKILNAHGGSTRRNRGCEVTNELHLATADIAPRSSKRIAALDRKKTRRDLTQRVYPKLQFISA